MPDPVTTVQNQLFPPGPPPADAITMYQGATQAKNGFAPWKAWDLRGPILKLAWDLLRFFPLEYGRPNPDDTVPYGMRDSIARIMFQVNRTEKKIDLIAAKLGVDLSGVK